MKIENTLTCQEFLDGCQLDDTWQSPISIEDFTASPECGEYRLEQRLVIVTVDGDEIIISDPENETTKYPVSVEN